MKKIENLIAFRMQKMLLNLKDHLHLLFRSAAHNHLRIQEIRRGEHGGIFCSLSFYSYTALKRYQKKVRVVSAALASGLTIFLVALALTPVFFDTSGSQAAGEAPIVSSINPTSGPSSGGTSFSITGNYFLLPDEYTKLLMHFNNEGNSFLDSSAAPKAITASGASTQSATQSKFGGKSGYFNGGASDYISVANSSDFNFGSGDFTVDWWEYRTNSVSASPIISRNTGGYSPFIFGYDSAGTEVVYMTSNGSSWDMASAKSMGAIQLNSWSHLAVVRSGNNFYTFRNGVPVSTWTSSSAILTSSESLLVGYYAGYLLKGYVDELRISKGIARWTSDFSAALPTSAYFEPIVDVGGVSATNIAVSNSTTITGKTPAHSAGAVDVTVTNYDGQSSTLSSGYTYTAPPTISSITPGSGLKTGGDSVTITGTNFYGTPTVTLGGTAATSVTVVNATTITAITSAHAAGQVDVVVTNPDSQSATKIGAFTYNELAPVVSSITPNSGPSTGGTSVTVSGNNFDGGIDGRVKLMLHGDGAGASITDSSITPKTVTVNSATQSVAQSKFGGSSILVGSGAYMTVGTSADFQFTGDYTVDTWIYPTSAPAASGEIAAYGNHVGGGQFWDFMMLPNRTMSFNLYNNGYLYSLNPATAVPLNTWTHVAAVRSGNNVYLFINGVLSANATYSGTFTPIGQTLFIGRHTSSSSQYFPGYIDEFRISKGVAWWTSNFTPPTIPYMVPNLKLGGTQVTNILTQNSSTITAVTPAHAPGTVDALFTNYDGQSSTLANSYTYTAPPTVTSITPSSGLKTGGDSVTITGTNFYGNPTVTLGGTNATNVTVVDATTITATTPAHTAGLVDVVVMNPDTQSATKTGGFTFNELAPIISSINPISGPVVGGTNVTISGNNFSTIPDSFTKLLLHADGNANVFNDSSLNLKTITANGNVVQSNSQSKFGGKSAYFDGSGDFLTVPYSSDFDFGTEDLTIDSWVKKTSAAGNYALVTGDNLGNTLVFYMMGTGLRLYAGGSTYNDWTYAWDTNWHHVALVKNAGVYDVFIDGVKISGSWANSNAISMSNGVMVGSVLGETNWWPMNGYIDEFRISKGVARWTENFSVPIAPHQQPIVKFGGSQAVNVSSTSATTITATTPAHVAGAVDVQVINPDSQSHALSSAFTYVPAPTVTGISQSSVTNNQSVAGINIIGIDFQSGATVKFKKVGETDIVCSAVIFNSATSLSCDGDFHGVKPGSWDIEVTNADGQIGSGAGFLTVIGEVTQIKFQTPSYTIKPNVASQAIRIQLQDSAGRPTKPLAAATIDLSKTSATGEFSLSRTSWSPISSITFTTADDIKTVYYKDSTLGTYTIGAGENPSSNWTDASQAITISNSAPYVWPFDVSADYQYDGAKVSIVNSDASLSDLAASGTTVNNVSSAALVYSNLTSFSEVLDSDNQGSVKYQLSNNDGTTWYWWNGTTWAAAGGVAQANDAATVNANIATFNSAIGQIGNAKLSFKAFLIGDGTQKVNLDSIFVGYTLYPYKYSFISKPASLNETEVGTFIVQAQDQFGNAIAVDHDTVVTLGSSTPATGFFATNLSEDISTRWDKTTITLAAGQNSATFYYKDSVKGSKTISVNPPMGESSIAASYNLNVTSKYRFLVTGVSDPIQAGVPSSVTIQAADYLGNPVTNYTGTVHFSSSDAASALPVDNTLTAPMLGGKTYVNGVTMMTQTEQCVTVTDVADSVITGSQCAITVLAPPAGVASKLKITSSPQFVPVGETSSSITVQLQDINGSAAVKATPTTVYVYRTTASGEFSADGSSNWTQGVFSVVIPAGSTSVNFFYRDTIIGNYILTASDDNVEASDIGLTNDSQQLSAVAGSPHSFSFNSGAVPIVAGTATGTLNFSLHDSLGNQVTTQNNQSAIITSTGGAEFSLDGVNNWTGKLITSIPAGGFENNFYYRNNAAGSDTIIISDSDPADGATGLVDANANVTVNASGASQFVFLNSPVNLNLGETSSQMTVQTRDIFGNVAAVSGDTSIYLYSSDPNTTFSSLSSPFVPIGQITIPNGGSSASFYFRQPVNNGSITITASDNATAPDGGAGIADASQAETISQGAVASFVITNVAPVEVFAGQESVAITVESRNASGVKVPMTNDTTVYFHSDSIAGLKEFSLNQSPSWSAVSSTIWTSGSDTITFYYKDTEIGSKTVTIGDDAIMGQENAIVNGSLNVNVNSLEASKISITSNPLIVEAGERGQIVVEMQDALNNPVLEGVDRVIDLSSDDTGGVFMDSGNNVVTTLTIPAGNSSAGVYYKNDSVSSQNLTFESVGLLSDTQIFEVIAGTPTEARMTISENNLIAGITSGAITAKLYNAHNIETIASADFTVDLTSSSATGRFDSNQSGTFSVNVLNIIIPVGQSSKTFYFKDTKSGSPAVYSNGSGLVQRSIDLNVAAGVIDHIKFISASQIITAGQISNSINGKIYDQYENEVVLASDIILNLSTSSTSGEFSVSNSPWNAVTSLNVATGQNSFSFFYKDSSVNVAEITVASLYGNIVQTESIISGPLSSDVPDKLLFQSSPQTLIINSPASIEFYLADSSDRYATAQSQLTAIVSSSSPTGEFFNSETASWESSLDVVFEAGESVKSVEFKDSVSGNPTIIVSSIGLTSAGQQETVVNGSIEKITLDASSAANTIDRIPVQIKTMTNGDLPVSVTSDTVFSLSQSGSGNFFATAGSSTSINSVTFEAGSSSKTVYFQQTIPGNVTIAADENPSLGWTRAEASIAVSTVPTKLKFSSLLQTKQAGQQSDLMTVSLEDVYGNVSNAGSDIALHLSSSSQFGEFSISDDNWSPTSTIVMAAGTNSASFFYRDTLAGAQTLTVSDVSSPAENPDTGLQNASQQYNVSTSDIYSLNFLTPANNLEIGQSSSAITVQAHDQYGNAKIVASDFPVYLYSTSATGKFSTSSNFIQANLVSNVKILAGTSVATFYYRDLQPNVSQIVVSDKNSLDDPDLDVLNASQQVNIITGNVARIAWESVPSTIEEGDGNVAIVVKTTNSSGIEIPVLSDLPIYFSARYATASDGSFAINSSGAWGINSSVIVAGNSRATFYYRDTIAGTPLIIVSDEPNPQENLDSGLANANSYIAIVQGAISKIVFNSAPQSIIANHPSSLYQVQTLNRSDIPTNVSSDKIIYLRSSSASGEFSLNGQDWGINGITIPAGSSIGSFYYRDAISGSYVLTAADSLPIAPDANWTNATQTSMVIPQQLDHFNVRNISDPQKQGTPSSVVVSPVDVDGYVIKEYAGTIVEFKVLDENGDIEPALLPDVPYTFNPAVDNGIKTFVNAVAFYSEGEKTFSVKDDSGVVGLQQNITVVQASTNPIEKVKFIDVESPMSIAKRTVSPLITVQIQDAGSDPTNVTSSGGYDLKIISPNGGEFSTDGSDWTSDEIVLNVKQYTNFATFYYRNSDKIEDILTLSDWNGASDDSAVSNDTLTINVTAGQAEYLQITGQNSQIAGTAQNISIVAKDQDGDIATSYVGEKEIILSGADSAFTGQVATCNDVEFGNPTALNFIDGEAECELRLYKKETAEIKATDGTISSFANNSWNLALNVAANTMNHALSVLSAIPNPQQVAAPVIVNVLPKDVFGNISEKSLQQLVLNVEGANIVSSQQFDFNVESGYYQASYIPQNSGTDLVSASLNGSSIGQDTQGASEGIVHEIIEGESVAAANPCGYLKLDESESESGRLVFDVCMEASMILKSDELSKSSTRGTWISRFELETEENIAENFTGEVQINSFTLKPSGMDLASSYLDLEKYVPYVFLKVQTDAQQNSIDNAKFRVIVSNNWVSNNSISGMIAMDGNGNSLEMKQVGSSEDSATFEIAANEIPDYFAVLGVKIQPEIIVTEDVKEDPLEKDGDNSDIIDRILDPVVVAVKKISDDNNESVASNYVSSSISEFFSVDSEKAADIVRTLAIVTTGAAAVSAGVATAASFPMLSYMFGGIRTLSAVPYGRKQKWGVVYDSQTGKPLSGALVIVSDENGKVKEMKNTDASGFYSFLAPKGTYTMEVRKFGYVQPENSHIVAFETYYDGSYIPGEKIELEQEGIISENIPMLKQEEALWQKIINPATITHTIFWGGFTFSIFALIIDTNYFNGAILMIFVANLLINFFYKKNLKTGKVLSSDLKPAGFATVKIFNKDDHSLVARTIANEKGVYFMAVSGGDYIIEAQNGISKCVQEISLDEHSEIKEQFILK